jgi:hypothetical protein
MCAEAGIGRAVFSPDPIFRRCPALLRGARDESSLTNPITSSKKIHSAKVFCLRVHEIEIASFKHRPSVFPRLQGICAEHLSYTSLNGALATVEHVFDNGEYLDAQQFAPPLHGFNPLF